MTPTQLSNQELLPCPFCGSEAIMTTAGIERQPLKQVEIECRQCKTSQDTLTRGETVEETNRIAITKWNTRTISGHGKELEEEKLRSLIKFINNRIDELKNNTYGMHVANRAVPFVNKTDFLVKLRS